MAIVSITKRLRECALWSGSNLLKYEFDHFGLSITSVVKKIDALKRCRDLDELTDDEIEYLAALEEIRKQHKRDWNE
jgi:hypothetical protein